MYGVEPELIRKTGLVPYGIAGALTQLTLDGRVAGACEIVDRIATRRRPVRY
jgi:hypothetical protein